MARKRADQLDQTLIELMDATKHPEKIPQAERDRLAHLLYERAQVLKSKQNSQDIAIDLLRNTVKCRPDFTAARLDLAHLLIESSSRDSDMHLFQEAYDQFRFVDESNNKNGTDLSATDYWYWGICDLSFAKHSEEPLDFRNAVEKLKKAYALGLRKANFLFDLGVALGELGMMTGSREVLVEAGRHLQESLESNSEQPGAWLRLALVYKCLYFTTGDYGFCEKADHSYVAASRTLNEHPLLWFSWGDMLIKDGVDAKDTQRIVEGIKHIETALSFDSESALIKARLADACMALGMLEEDYELLKEALTILQEMEPSKPDLQEYYWLYANCLIHIGRYFGELSYIRHAMQKVEEGFKQYPEFPPLWHTLGVAYYTQGEIQEDSESFNQAAKFFSHAIRLSPKPPAEWYNECGICYMKMAEVASGPVPMDLAIELLRKAIEIEKAAGRKPLLDWVYNLGAAYDFFGEQTGEVEHYEKAISILSQLVEQYPEFSHLRYNLALAYYHLGDTLGEIEPLEKAEEHFESLLQNQEEIEEIEYALDDYAMCLATMAELLVESGQGYLTAKKAYEKSETLLLESIRLGSLHANFSLACLYASIERFEEAMHFLERCKTSSVLPSQEVLLETEWLDRIREYPPFKIFIATLEREG